jgi:hypothetical protein
VVGSWGGRWRGGEVLLVLLWDVGSRFWRR